MTTGAAAPPRTDALGTRVATPRTRIALAAVSLVGTLALWMLASTSGWVDKILLPSPLEVARAFSASVADGRDRKSVV